MAIETAEDWLAYLVDKKDKDADRVLKLFAYVSGDAPFPELSRASISSWKKQQKLAVTDVAALIVAPAVSRIGLSGVNVVDSEQLSEKLRETTRRLRFEAVMSKVVHDALVTGEAYFLIGGEGNEMNLSAESQLSMTVAPHPTKPWKARAAAKFQDDVVDGVRRAYVWTGAEEVVFERPLPTQKARLFAFSSGAWKRVSDREMTEIPVVVYTATQSGRGCFENHTKVIDSLHQRRLLHSVLMMLQTWKATAVIDKGAGPEDEDEDAGPGMDLSHFLDPGALTELSGDVSVWQSQGITNDVVGQSIKDLYRELAELTGTPMAAFSSDAANQSAEAANAQRTSLLNRVSIYVENLQRPVEAVLVKIAELFPLEGYDGETITVSFQDIEHSSYRERMDALNLAKSAGVPWRSRMELVGGFSQDEVDKMEREMMFEQALLTAQTRTQTAQTTEAVEEV